MKLPKSALPLLLLAATALPTASAQQAQQPKPKSPEALFKSHMNDRIWKLDYTGEDFGWQAGYGMTDFLDAYDQTHDTSYLDYAAKYNDALIAKMAVGPDGYKGWIGPFEYDSKYWCDAHVGDAILFNGILDFSFHVFSDPALKQKYGEKALAYVNEAKKDLFEKWDARGTYHEDGPFAFYVTWDKYGLPGDLKDWKFRPESKAVVEQSNSAHPFNKDIDIAVASLRIWQCTGDEAYKHRAEKLFGFMKSRMQLFDGAYHWNYWEPAYIGDLGKTPEEIKAGEWNPAAAEKSVRSWINVHGQRNYQDNEVANIVIAYNAGIVFTEADIKGIIHTNLKVMWNGDENKPLYANSNADLQHLIGKPEFYHPANTPEKGGTLWSPLAQFDPTIRKLAGRAMAENSPPSFDRKNAKNPVEIPAVYAQFPLGNVRSITMACALPSIFPLGQNSALCCKIMDKKAALEVDLYSPDGNTKIATLKKGDVSGGPSGRDGILYFMFNGSDPATGKTFAPGNYRIRWTVPNDGYREFPITLQPKK